MKWYSETFKVTDDFSCLMTVAYSRG